MSNRVLSLALKITGDASGVRLTPVERALQRLGTETDKVGKVFEKFARDSEAGARAQARFQEQSSRLTESLKAGAINSQQYATEFERLAQAANEEAAALERAARITEASLTPLERFSRQQAELTNQLNAGRITLDTYNKTIESSAKSLSDADRAAAGLAARQKEIEGSAGKTGLQFNQLSGIFAALPGPLGNIAGRISGLTSASQGLSQIFAGGLKSGVSGLAGSLTSLLNPATLAVAGIAAIGTIATQVAQGLVALEDRVERLGRLADQLGISFGFVQTLEEAGKRTDVSIEQLSGSFARLQNTLAGADEESKKAVAALGRLGVSVQEFSALSEEQRIELIGERLAQIEDPAQRSAAAIALFGRSGVQLLPFFRELPQAASDVERLGRAVTDLDRRRLADFGSGIDALGVATQGLSQSLLIPFAGLAERIAQTLASVTSGITGILNPIGQVLEPILTNLGRALELVFTPLNVTLRVLGALLAPVGEAFSAISETLEPILDALGSFVQLIGDGIVQVASFVASFSPFNLIGALFRRLSEFLQPLFAAFARFQEIAGRVFGIIQAAVRRFSEIWTQTVGAVIERVREIVAAFLEWTGLGDQISQSIEILTIVFNKLYNTVVQVVDSIGLLIDNTLTAAETFFGIARDTEQPITPEIDTAPAIDLLQGDLAKLQESVAEFGDAGTQAFLKYNEQLEQIAEFVAEGEYDGEAEKRAIAQATAEFERQREVLKGLADEQRRAAEEAEQRAQQQAEAIQSLIDASQEQLRIDQEFDGDSARFRAAENLLLINEEIARVTAEIDKARQANDQAAIDALTARLSTLDQVAAREDDIASGAQRQREEAAREAEKVAEDARREAERAAQAAERIAEQRRQAEERINKQIEDSREKLAERQFEIERQRAEELAGIRSGAVQIQDIRSGGISAFFATLQEDPALTEARKQSKELEQIRKGIDKLEAEKVDILAGVG